MQASKSWICLAQSLFAKTIASTQMQTRELFNARKLSSNTVQFTMLAPPADETSDGVWLPQQTSHLHLKQGTEATCTAIEQLLRNSFAKLHTAHGLASLEGISRGFMEALNGVQTY